MTKKAIYAGTFDPFTNGHDDILRRALQIFDHMTVVVAVSATKAPFFTLEQRVEMITRHYKSDKRVSVTSWEGLIVDYAAKENINHFVRGLRPTGDFEIEFQMAAMNNALNSSFETVFLPTGGDHYFVSSSLVKEIARHRGDISAFVPETILKYANSLE